MLMALLDATVIVALVSLVNQGERLDFMPALIAGIGISIGCLVVGLLLAEYIGLLVVVPMAAVAIGGIWMVAGIPLDRAAIAGVIFLVYRIVVSFVYAALTSSPAAA